MKRSRWRPTFGTRHQVNAQEENASTWLEAPFNINDGDFIGNCMRDATNASTCSPQADLLHKIYGTTHYNDVHSEGMKQKKVALVDDCAFQGEQQHARRHLGPRTAYELYELLREPRFHIQDTNGSPTDDTVHNGSSTNSITNSGLAEHNHMQPDADRRLIYLTDLDRWSVLALLSTASMYQIEPLRHLLYRHLAPEAYVGIASCPHEMFELAFHLPFRAWRPQSNGDDALDVTDVSFLDLDGKSSGFLHSPVYSCSVAGSDDWHWVAYGIVDTQFQGSSQHRESAEDCFDAMLASGSFSMDPCGNMSFPNDGIGPNPRYWFLLVLKARLVIIIDEWMQIAHHVHQCLQKYERVRFPLLEHLSP